MAWEVAGQKELQELSLLKSSLSIKSSQNEIDHALQYFEHRIKDFPGEFFLQSPFVFLVRQSVYILFVYLILFCLFRNDQTNKCLSIINKIHLQSMLQLIECENQNFDHTPALTCCLKLTQNLARRITIRRVSSLHVAKRTVNTIITFDFSKHYFSKEKPFFFFLKI